MQHPDLDNRAIPASQVGAGNGSDVDWNLGVESGFQQGDCSKDLPQAGGLAGSSGGRIPFLREDCAFKPAAKAITETLLQEQRDTPGQNYVRGIHLWSAFKTFDLRKRAWAAYNNPSQTPDMQAR